MMDLTKTIIAKSDQMNADDLMGGGKTIKVTKVSLHGDEQPVAIHYEGDDGKPFKPCKSMRRVIVNAWGKDGNKYIGKSMTLYRDENVKYAGMSVGGIRISHMSDIDKALTMSLTASSKSKKAYTVKPLEVKQVDTKYYEKMMLEGDVKAGEGMDVYKAWFKDVRQSDFTPEQKSEFIKMHEKWKPIAEDANQEECPI